MQYKPFTPRDVGEISELLSMMMLNAPTFEDPTGFFEGRNVETVFPELEEGLTLSRWELGQERYDRLLEMSRTIRTLFEADPLDQNGKTSEGRKLINEMRAILRELD